VVCYIWPIKKPAVEGVCIRLKPASGMPVGPFHVKGGFKRVGAPNHRIDVYPVAECLHAIWCSAMHGFDVCVWDIKAQTWLYHGAISNAVAVAVELETDGGSFHIHVACVEIHPDHVAIGGVTGDDIVVLGSGAPSEPQTESHSRGRAIPGVSDGISADTSLYHLKQSSIHHLIC
jgi:hypothetical protein